MRRVDIVDLIEKFLNLSLSEAGLKKYYEIKKTFDNDIDMFFEFIAQYLSIQKGGITLKDSEVYQEFSIYMVRYTDVQGEDRLLDQIARYAKYFIMLRLEYVQDKSFARSISVINAYEAWSVYPFLMEVLDDFENSRITNDGLLSLLAMVEELLLERALDCDTSDLSSISLDINKMLLDSIAKNQRVM